MDATVLAKALPADLAAEGIVREVLLAFDGGLVLQRVDPNTRTLERRRLVLQKIYTCYV